MKATEFRIGNFCKWNGPQYTEQATIASLDLTEVSFKCGDYGMVSDLEPIPLTEEWLTDFGFIDEYKSYNKHWSIYGFTINQQSDEDYYGNKIPQEQIFYYQYQYDIKFVHQLQNLYFALTGKELTINREQL
jgi:hypothetical protein